MLGAPALGRMGTPRRIASAVTLLFRTGRVAFLRDLTQASMKTYYDVLQLLKGFGTFIHVGKREWDIELAALELDRLHKAQLIDDKVYLNAKSCCGMHTRKKRQHPLNHELPLPAENGGMTKMNDKN